MMSESPNKKIKLTIEIPEDIVECIFLLLPIQSVKQYVVSKRFRDSWKRSPNLDFSGIFSVRRRSNLEAVRIIENIFNQHEGSKINRFVLSLNHVGVEDKILSWINTCLSKNIKELVLDFSRSKKVVELPINFSSIETLTVLKLHWCKFEIPNNLPTGLKLLTTLSLKRIEVTKEMIDAIFLNCIHLESLELIECRMYGNLSIHAKDHKKFKSLIVSSMPNIWYITLDAPTLECYKYDGYGRTIHDLIRVNVLKEAKLLYTRNKSPQYYDSSFTVLASIGAYTGVRVLTTTNIFLEALMYRYVEGGKWEKPPFKFWNLTDFKIFFKAPTICTLFDIAEFLKDCPNLKRVEIDIQKITFEPQLYFWEIHHKEQIVNNNYNLEFLKEVRIIGYKGHWHELDMVEFFAKNAPSLVKLELLMLKKSKTKAYAPDYARINFIRSKFPTFEANEV